MPRESPSAPVAIPTGTTGRRTSQPAPAASATNSCYVLTAHDDRPGTFGPDVFCGGGGDTFPYYHTPPPGDVEHIRSGSPLPVMQPVTRFIGKP